MQGRTAALSMPPLSTTVDPIATTVRPRRYLAFAAGAAILAGLIVLASTLRPAPAIELRAAGAAPVHVFPVPTIAPEPAPPPASSAPPAPRPIVPTRSAPQKPRAEDLFDDPH
jgi:hypothetical protein